MWEALKEALSDERYRLRTVRGLARATGRSHDDVVGELRVHARTGEVLVIPENTGTLWFGLAERFQHPRVRAFIDGGQANQQNALEN
jgi:hypothetical protein